MVDEVEMATAIIATAIEEQSMVTANITDNSRKIMAKNSELVSEIEDLKRITNELNFVRETLQLQSRVLEELTTTQITGSLFNLESKAVSAEELAKYKVNAIINLGILGHIVWKVSFMSDLIEGEVPKVERVHRRCLLGRSLNILKEKVRGRTFERSIDEL